MALVNAILNRNLTGIIKKPIYYLFNDEHFNNSFLLYINLRYSYVSPIFIYFTDHGHHVFYNQPFTNLEDKLTPDLINLPLQDYDTLEFVSYPRSFDIFCKFLWQNYTVTIANSNVLFNCSAEPTTGLKTVHLKINNGTVFYSGDFNTISKLISDIPLPKVTKPHLDLSYLEFASEVYYSTISYFTEKLIFTFIVQNFRSNVILVHMNFPKRREDYATKIINCVKHYLRDQKQAVFNINEGVPIIYDKSYIIREKLIDFPDTNPPTRTLKFEMLDWFLTDKFKGCYIIKCDFQFFKIHYNYFNDYFSSL